MTSVSLDFLRHYRVGDWVVIDSDMTRVLAAATTPEEALKLAGVNLGAIADDGPRPIIMQVPDSSLPWLYATSALPHR